MTLDEAIKYAEDMATLSHRGSGNAECEHNHRQLAEWLKDYKQLLEQEPKWIPVNESERLPEAEYGESESVLVCFENETQDVLYFNGSNWCYPTGEVYISVNHKNDWHNKVIAWLPLPEPYREG